MYRFSAVAVMLLSIAPLWADDSSLAADNSAPPRRVAGAKPKADSKPADAAADKSISRKDVVRSLEQEQAVYLERLQICTRLRQVAVQTGDDDLFRQAAELELQAEEVYQKRTSKLPAIMDTVKQSEAALEQKRNAPPVGSASASRVVTGRAPNGRPIVGGE